MGGFVCPVVVVITVAGNKQEQPEFKSWTGQLHFTLCQLPGERYESRYLPSNYGPIVWQTSLFNLGMATSLREQLLKPV